jgi:D-lactate dehydrogenase
MGLYHKDTETNALPQQIIHLLEKSKFEVVIPKNVDELCCGMAFNSKGYTMHANVKNQEMLDTLKKIEWKENMPVS